MNPTHFEIDGFGAVVDGPRVQLHRGDDHVATLTFRATGVYTIVERGRGDADRLPAELQDNVRAATMYVVRRFWPTQLRQAA